MDVGPCHGDNCRRKKSCSADSPKEESIWDPWYYVHIPRDRVIHHPDGAGVGLGHLDLSDLLGSITMNPSVDPEHGDNAEQSHRALPREVHVRTCDS